ncbi:MAG: hypothetical protein H6609_18950 [Ignavibacteriales bacterium]|nr:hypothetical protein [Ignavibacteriales bacterium]
MDDFIDLIDDANKNGEYNRWVAYAQNNLNMTKILREYEGEDIVKIVIIKTFEGTRTWKRELPINIYMRENIRSVIYALKSKKQRSGYESSLDENYMDVTISGNGKVISEAELHKDMDEAEMLAMVEDSLAGDDEALLVLEEWKIDDRNKVIGKELGLEPKEVSNIKRRIKYKSQKKADYYKN